MTENLIINGIDHSVFNLEWAKRGGVFVVKPKYMEINDETMRDYDFFYTFCAGKVICINDYNVIGLDDGSTYVGIIDSINNDGYLEVRMATPSECAEEGVEYIEPPMRWRPIETAPEDGRIIEVADFRVVVANECPLSKHWKFWRDIPHPLNKNSMTQPLKDE